MATRAETKMVTGKINGQDVTVPAGTTILEAARMANIEVPNLCYQPLLRPWGSCRICTVEILGKRGGLIESCATPLGEGMEVLTHSEPVEDARQFILQMYLIDHALDCPTCDKSGECYLQDNTYLTTSTPTHTGGRNSRSRMCISATRSTTSAIAASCAIGARASATK